MIIRVETSQKLRKNDCKQRRNNEEMGGIISSKKEPEKTLPPNARIVSDKESTRRRKNEPVVERESKRIKEKMEPLPPPSIQVDIPPLIDQPPRPAGVSPRNIQKPITPTVSVKGFAFPPNTQPKDYFKTVHSAVRWQKPNIAEILDHPDTVDCLDEKTGNLPILTLLIRSLILYMPYHIYSVLLTWFTLSCRLGNLPIHIAAQNGYIEIVRILLDKSCAINAVNKKGRLLKTSCPYCQSYCQSQPHIQILSTISIHTTANSLPSITSQPSLSPRPQSPSYPPY